MTSSNKLIVALDIDTFSEMKSIVESIGEAVSIYKIGHQLFISEGPKTITYLKEQGKDIFLDLKLHEIPNSVASAVKAAGKYGVNMLTVHASGGQKMMQAAVEAANGFPNLRTLALTVITGLSDRDLVDIGFEIDSTALVLRLAQLAKESGCHGVIASPKEVESIRNHLGSEFLIVTPGVRPLESENHDQHRVGTPQQAIRSGASFIIMGRPIVRATQPALAAKEVISQLSA